MTYEEFMDEFQKHLSQELEHADIEKLQLQKINGKRDVLAIREGDCNTVPIIYIDDQYEKYMQGDSVEDLARQVADNYTECMREEKIDDTFVPEPTYQDAQKNLYCAVINGEMNKELLKTVPHERIEDLAIIPRMKVGNIGSYLVTTEICGMVGMTEKEILQTAKANTAKEKFVCRDLTEVVCGIMKSRHMPQSYIDETRYMGQTSSPIYMLTNEAAYDGAAILTSPEAMDQVRERIGEDFYIIPSSRHEVLALPISEAPDIGYLKSVVDGVNKEVSSKLDVLSNEVYRYDSLTRKISIADKMVNTLGKTEKKTKGKGR